MANEELREQINLEQELNRLSTEYNETQGKGNSTLKDRVYHLQEAMAHQDDNNKLGQIQKDLLKQAAVLAKNGNKILAKKYTTAAKTVTQQISSNKVEEKNKKLQEKLGKEREKQLNFATGLVSSTLSMVGISGGLVAVFSQFNKLTATIGKNFGALGMTNEKFKSDMMEANVAAVGLGKSMEDVAAVSKDLTDNFGFGRDESVAMAQGIMDTSMALGLSDAEGTKLLGTLTQIGGMSLETAQNFAKQTALLAEAEGVSPNTVMRDIAASSETIAKFTAMTPEHLAKAAIQATKLGTNLNTIAGSMESMLDFQSSLNAEMEAQVMIGRNVNLQKARELALAGKADEFAVELTKQVGSQAEFEKMNVLQRQSLAKALGINVEQMAKMVSNQDKVRSIGEAIAQQDGLEKMIGREAMDNMAKIVADLKQVGAEVITSIGPAVSQIAGAFASVTGKLSEMGLLLPAIGVLLGAMVTKSMVLFALQAGITYASSVKSLGPVGLALLLAAPVVIGGLLASLTQVGDLGIDPNGGPIVASPQMGGIFQGKKGDGLSMGPTFGTKGGGTGNGGGISKDDMKSAFADAMKPLVEENQKIRAQNETLISETKRTGARTADALAEIS
tara:strand:+ start:296 stop:2146 length:1851 start_codon:yes stop_codon:yes gene_type:complete